MNNFIPVTVKPRFVGFNDIKQYRFTEGLSLEEIALECADSLPPEFWTGSGVICVGGERVPRNMWHRVRPRVIDGREVAVTLNIVPHGDQQTTGIITTLAGVAITAAGVVLIATPYGAPLIAAGIGITLSGALMLFAPVPPQPKEGARTQSLQAGVSENSAAPFEWLPRVLGRMLYSPPQLIRPYTVYSRRSIKVCGAVGMVGRHTVNDVRINGALASSMTNLTYQTKTGAPGDTALTIGNQWVYEESPRLQLSNFDLKTDASNRDELFDQSVPLNSYPQYQTFLTRTGTYPDKVVMRILFPQGMVADTSDNVTMVIPLRVEFRLRGSSTWILGPEFHFYDENKGNAEIRQNLTFIWQADASGFIASPNSSRVATVAYRAAAATETWQYLANSYFSNGSSVYAYHVSRDVDGYTVYLDPAVFPKTAHYEFRVKRGLGFRYGLFDQPGYNYNGSGTNANFFDHYTSSSVHLVRVEQYKFRGEVAIEAFQTWHNAYPLQAALSAQIPLTLIAFEGKDMEINSVSARFDSEVPIWNGSNWNTIAATRNPAAHYRHVLVDSLNADPRELAVINSGVLQDWYNACNTLGYQCNAVVTDNEPQVLLMIASAGWAGPRSHEQWEIIREENTAAFAITQNFTPINSSNYIASKAFADLPHAFNIEFFDEADDYKISSDIVYALGFSPSTATRFETLRFDGFTNRTKARDRAVNILRSLYLRQTERRIDVGIEALVSKRGDIVGLSHDLRAANLWFGLVVRVLTSGANVTGIILNAKALLSQGSPPYGAVLRYMNGQVVIKGIIGSADSDNIMFQTPFTIPAGNVLRKGCLVSIGPFSQETTRCRITNITYKDEFTATVSLVDEAPQIYTGVFQMIGLAEGQANVNGVGGSSGALIKSMQGNVLGVGTALAGGDAILSTSSRDGLAFGTAFVNGVGTFFGTISAQGVAEGIGEAAAEGDTAGISIQAGAGLVDDAFGDAVAEGESLITISSGTATGAGTAAGVGAVPVPSVNFLYKGVVVDPTNRAAGVDYSFAANDIGVAHANRVVIICIGGAKGVSGLTVGGVNASQVNGGFNNFQIYRATVPSGTTADFVIPHSLSSDRCFIAWGIFYPAVVTHVANLSSGVSVQAGTTNASITWNAADEEVGGLGIMWGGRESGLCTFTTSFTGNGTITEHVDAQAEAFSSYVLATVKFAATLTTGDAVLAASTSGTKVLATGGFGAPA